MNILFTTTHLNVGGITNYLFNLANGCIKLGHHVFVASSGGGWECKFKEIAAVPLTLDIRTKQEIGFMALASIPRLTKIVKDNTIDVIHSNTRVTQVVSGAVSRLTGVPHVTTYHGFFKHAFIRRLFPCMGKGVIAVSEPVRDYLVKNLGVPSNRVALIYNGIDTGRFAKTYSAGELRANRKRFGLKERSRIIGIIARLSTVKGHPDLLRAFAEVQEMQNDVELLVIGEGSIKRELVDLARALRIDQAVRFVDSVNDTRIPLSIMDIFAMPSHMEGFGLAILEAMAAGKAVVGTRIGGITEVVEDGKDGLLVPAGRPQELAGALLKLLNDEGRRKQLGEAARLSASQKFPIEKTVRKTVELYESICRNMK
jgi:glycosyltransferase involved in cell wall biosynthesis